MVLLFFSCKFYNISGVFKSLCAWLNFCYTFLVLQDDKCRLCEQEEAIRRSPAGCWDRIRAELPPSCLCSSLSAWE